MEIVKAKSSGALTQEVADFLIDIWKSDDPRSKKVKMTYRVFKSNNDLEDFTNSLTSLYKKLKK